jgi:linoleoyl-CoA desaturase
MLLVIFDLLGTNSYNWKNRHLGSHHAYPNIMGYDSDAQQTSMVKVFPKDKHRFYHAYQHIYMPFLYMFYMLRWVFYRDFKDAGSDQIGYFDNRNYPKKELIKLIFFKIFYLFYILILPYLILDFSIWTMLLAFFIMTVSASMVVMTVLLSSHVGDDTNFPEPDENGLMPHSWSYHQVITTADYGTNTWFYNQLFGGFNHHLIHHFFPHICHIHYPNLTPILREKVAKYNLPYRHKKSLYESMSSHFKLLANNSREKKGSINLQDIFQDI